MLLGEWKSRNESPFLTQLDSLRPPPRSQLVEDAAGMGLDRVLADEELLGDFAVAQTIGDELQDLQLAGGDAQFLEFAGIDLKRTARGNRAFLYDNLRLRELEPQPDPNTGKDRRPEPAIDLERMFH